MRPGFGVKLALVCAAQFIIDTYSGCAASLPATVTLSPAGHFPDPDIDTCVLLLSDSRQARSVPLQFTELDDDNEVQEFSAARRVASGHETAVLAGQPAGSLKASG